MGTGKWYGEAGTWTLGRYVICLIANPNLPRGEQSSGLPDSLGGGWGAGKAQLPYSITC